MPVSMRMLGEDEEVVVDLHPHWVFLAFPLLCTSLAIAFAVGLSTVYPKLPSGVGWALLVVMLVPMAWLGVRLARWFSISLVVTTSRVLLRRGVFRRDVAQLRLARVTEVHTAQSLSERLIGSGRVIFDVAGDEAPVVVTDVRRPRALQRVIVGRLEALRTPGPAAPGGSGGGRPGVGSGVGPGVGPGVDVGAAAHVGAGRGLADPDQRTPPHGVSMGPAAEPTAPPAAPVAAPVAPSVHQQLIELDDLRRRGIVTEQEFAMKKADLLRRL